MRFVHVDESTVTDAQYGGQLTAPVLAQMAAAHEIQLNRDVSLEYGGNYRVRAGDSKEDIQPGEIVCVIVDALPNAPGAVAYHDTTGASVPVVFAARTQCSSLLEGAHSLSCALSHELCETVGDEACNLWVDDGSGAEFARELCDATENDTYEINGVTVSNFVLKAFFAPGSVGPFTYLGTVGTDPISSPLVTGLGGYQIKRSGAGNEAQVFGELHEPRLAKKRHFSSRTYRRGVRL